MSTHRSARTMVNAHTWTRITRFDLHHLSVSVGNAALEELANWKLSGDGRKVKELTEGINRKLESTFDRSDLDYIFDNLGDVLARFREIELSPFYHNFLSSKLYSDRKGNSSNFSEAISSIIEKSTDYIERNRPAPPVAKAARREERDEPPVRPAEELELPNLGDVVPAQKVAPLQFEIRNGKLHTKKQTAKPNAQDRRNVSSAKFALQIDANSVLDGLKETNADPRLSSAVAEIRNVLSSDSDIIRLGIASISCDSLVKRFADQLPDVISARFEAFSAGLSLFVGQFPEWQQFVENANACRSLDEHDIAIIYNASSAIVEKLENQYELVDPQVPISIKLLIEAMSNPKNSSKRAVFGVVRTLENLFGTIFIGFGGILSSSHEGLKEGVKTSIKYGAMAVILGAAAQGALTVSPSVAKLIQSDWMEQASKIVEKSLHH